jgi:hypothetical protein
VGLLAALVAAGASTLLAQNASAVSLVSSTGSVNAGMSNPGVTRVLTDIPVSGRITDLNVSVRISHTYDPDLLIAIRPPGGTYVVLSNSRGGFVQATNDDYGSGAASCSGTQTTFDDSASTPIGAAAAPFNGSFVPEQPLAGVNGSPTLGRWELYLYDTNAIGPGVAAGTLHCATLTVNYTPLKKKKKKKKGKK